MDTNNLQKLVICNSYHDVELSSTPKDSHFIYITGFYKEGDGGGALYKRVATEPQHTGRVQSKDGAWWEISPRGKVVDFRSFGAVGDGVKDCTSAFQLASAYSKAVAKTILIPNGTYLAADGTEIGGSSWCSEDTVIIKNLTSTNTWPLRVYGKAIDNSWFANGKSSTNIFQYDSIKHIYNTNMLGSSGEGPTGGGIYTWYEGEAENSYLVNNQNYYSFIQYGQEHQSKGGAASGTVGLYGGHINVHGVKNGSSGRSELTPLALGLNFANDAVGKGCHLYNDIVVSGPVSNDAYFRESFMSGLSLLVNKYTPGNWVDNNHVGSYGLVIATRPQIGGFAFDGRETSSYEMRAGIVVCGFSGNQSVFDGNDKNATTAYQYGILVGGGDISEGGGSQWLNANVRSKITYGIYITDYLFSGIRIQNPNVAADKQFVNAIHVEANAGRVHIDSLLYLPTTPQSPENLPPGTVWSDNGFLKLV